MSRPSERTTSSRFPDPGVTSLLSEDFGQISSRSTGEDQRGVSRRAGSLTMDRPRVAWYRTEASVVMVLVYESWGPSEENQG